MRVRDSAPRVATKYALYALAGAVLVHAVVNILVGQRVECQLRAIERSNRALAGTIR